MTSRAHTGYLVRYLKQFDYIKQRKTRNGKIHRHSKSLFISNELHLVTRSGVLDYILKSTQYKQFPKKKKGTKEKDGKRSVIGRKEKKRDKGERQKKKKHMRKLWKKKEGRKEKRGGEVEMRRKKINRKTERAARKMHCPLRTHSLAKS